MKILQLIQTVDVSYGGPSRNSFELNLTLNKIDGVSAQLIYMKRTPNRSVIDTYGGALGPLPARRPAQLRLLDGRNAIGVRRLYALVRGADVIVVHQYYLGWILPLAILAKLLRTPFVITPHGSLTFHQQTVSVLKKRIFELLVGRFVRDSATGWVTGSEIEAGELRASVPGARVSVGGVGTPVPQQSLTNGWHEPLRLLALSRIAPKKRHDLILGAVGVLRERDINVHLDIVGDGPDELKMKLERQCQALGIESVVTFHGQKTGQDKERFYFGSDIYVLPSDDENFGISLAEALAHGLPCVSSAAVAAAQDLPLACGRVLSSPTPESIADAVEDLQRGSRREFARAAQRYAQQNFSWMAAGQRWHEALVGIIEEDASGR
ncbi:glycosyltransferase involved in cell wall biosynthesis [Sinomonas atrocyanea]|uniref:glycosyltransferase n=1 Tax=Sinomonas atrocyanea TaxID=37927 RepID=UPI002789D982|nr:glycosyltransferase [Sinomonas atrocyanea]MDP9885843.1 glycosyltransferase involved in cell wall biosynthesis [Sinomonas atrocyanea]